MNKRHQGLGLLAALAAAAVLATVIWADSEAEKGPEPVDPKALLGKELPTFEMKDYAGTLYKSAALKDRVVVLVLSSQRCPYSRAADPRLAMLTEEYRDKPVVVLSIDSHRDTEPDQIRAYAEKDNDTGKKLPFPILKDWRNAYANALGAKRTPEIYIANQQGVLVYHGALDNQKKPEDPGYVNYVAKAVDELLAGKPVGTPSTGAYGCGIKRMKGHMPDRQESS